MYVCAAMCGTFVQAGVGRRVGRSVRRRVDRLDDRQGETCRRPSVSIAVLVVVVAIIRMIQVQVVVAITWMMQVQAKEVAIIRMMQAPQPHPCQRSCGGGEEVQKAMYRTRAHWFGFKGMQVCTTNVRHA